MSKTAKNFEEEYPKKTVFWVKTARDEDDLFDLLCEHNVKYTAVLGVIDTYYLNFKEVKKEEKT